MKKNHQRLYQKGSSHALSICGNLAFAWPDQKDVPKNYKLKMN